MENDGALKKKEIVFLCVLILTVIIFRLQFNYMPPDRDEGACAYVAAQTYSGAVPYKDTFGTSQPFVYYLYRAAFDCFGISAESVRTFATVYVIFTLLLVYVLARSPGGGFIAMLAAFFYALYQHNHLLQAMPAGAEVFAQFPLLLSMLFLLDREKGYENVGFFLSGFFMATAFFTEIMAGPALLVPAVYVLFHPDIKKHRAKYVLWYLCGVLTVGVLVLAWCLKNNALQEFVRDNFASAADHAPVISSMSASGMFWHGMSAFAVQNLPAAAALVFAVIKMFVRFRDRTNFVTGLTALALIAGIAAAGGVYPHYFLLLIPVTAVLAAFMFRDMFVFIKNHAGAWTAGAVILVLLAACVLSYEKTTRFFESAGSDRQAMDIFYDAANTGNFIRNTKKAGDRLFVLADEPEIYFLSGIRSMSPYTGMYQLEYDKEAEKQVIESVISAVPEFLVVEKGREGEIKGLIKERYNIILGGGHFNLYRKNGGEK